MKQALILFFLLVLAQDLSYGQSMERVHQYLDTLSSPGMQGRGAGFHGDSLASAYIKDRFRQMGLSPLTTSYYQYFTYDVNTFPDNFSLEIGKKKLKPGKEVITTPFSGGGKGSGKIYQPDTAIFSSPARKGAFLKKDLKNLILVLDKKSAQTILKNGTLLRKAITARAVIELQNKLTASLAGEQIPVPWFQVLQSAWPEKAQKARFDLDADLIKDHQSRNVIGKIKGTVHPDSVIVISAHYDHLGRMGREVYFPGANDNASGISMLLELAYRFSRPENKPKFSLVFMAFGAEEAGLIGSHYYVQHPLFPLSEIKFLINLDLLGTGDDGIMVVNATEFPEAFNTLQKINQNDHLVKEIKKRGPAANSDHYFFYKAGVPCFFMYTLGGIAAYHDVYDIAATLPFTDFEDVYKLLVRFVKSF